MGNYFLLYPKNYHSVKTLQKLIKKKEENKLNNCERQNENNIVDYSANYNFIHNNFYQINFPEFLMYININIIYH